MKQPDWEKAPEGATHWEPRYGNTPESWMKFVGGLWFWFSADRDVWLRADPVCQERIHAMVEKPHAQWNGDGLPPIDTVCQCTNEKFEWLTGTIVYHGKTQGCRVAVMQCEDEILFGAFDEFRPIRTKAQIEAEAREAEIAEIDALISARMGRLNVRELATAIYDRNNRKGETK